jgi:GWxTD domain-containing protein
MILAVSPEVSAGRVVTKTANEEAKFLVDWAQFTTLDSSQVRLEVYFQFYNNALEFKRKDKLYQARYYLKIEVEGKGDAPDDTFTKDGKVRVASAKRAALDYRTDQANFLLPPGDYEVKATLKSLDGGPTHTRDFEVQLESRWDKPPRLSDIELVQAVGSRDSSEQTGMDAFHKGGLVVVPSLSRGFGGDGNNPLLFYVEIYKGSADVEEVVVETLIREKNRSMVYRDSVHTKLVEPITRQLRNITVEEFEPGPYELEISILGRRLRELDERQTTFTVHWSVESLMDQDYEALVEQISYIASDKEVDKLEAAKTLEERREAFDAFWQKVDPTPGSRTNELKTEFYRRVRVANESFSHMTREGWQTDRGRIYISYGEPDEIDDYPYSLSSVPYQEWHYYRDGRYRKFTFVDVNLDGEYRLQYPYDGLDQRPDF